VEIEPGTYTFGPSGGQLLVKTGRAGAAFLVGQDMTIEVTSWEGKLEVGEDRSDMRIELTADGGSLKVTDGKGGPVTLTDLDKKSLSKTVNEKVLAGTEIKFHSDSAKPSDDGSCIDVTGELQIFDEKTSLEFRLTIEQEGEEEDEEEDGRGEGEAGDEDSRSESQKEGEHEAEARAGDDSGGSGEDSSEPDDATSEHEEDDATSEHEDDASEEEEGDDDAEAEDDDEDEREQRISGRAVFKQTDVGLQPHSTLLGLLRVRDEVEVTFESKLEK
jgi:hypothetical protein